jgi:hypothetical protein
MGKSPSPSPGQDWPHEGCCGNILASRDSWKQPEARARQRYREVAAHSHHLVIYLTLRLRHVSPTMLKSVPAGVSLTAYTTLLYSSRTRRTLFMVLLCAFGLVPTRNALRRSATCESESNRTSSTTRTRHTGSLTVLAFSHDTPCTTSLVTTSVACGFTGTRLRIFSTPKKCPAS